MILRVLILSVLASGLFSFPASAGVFDGVEKATLEIDGKEYVFPVGGEERKSQIYYLKKGLRGDKEALELFLEGKDEKWFFIGMESPLWLKVSKNNIEVIKP